MKKKIFQLIPLFALVISTLSFGYSNSCDPKPEECCKPCCTETPSTVCPTTPAYNAPARVDVACGWDAFISASFLLFQPIENGIDVAHEYRDVVDAGITTRNITDVKMDFDWDPAFKVALGFSSDRDDWKLMLEYSRIYSSSKKSKTLDDASGTIYLRSPWIEYSTVNASYASTTWKLNMDILDLELSRPYYLGQQLIFNPFIGMRGGWIDQKVNARVLAQADSAETKASMKSDSWLIGFRAGLETNWMLGEGFRLFGDIAGSLLYQDFDISNSPEPINDTTFVKIKKSIDYITPNFEIGLGFGYGTYFANDEWFFDMTIGYEFHAFLNQNQMKAWYDNTTNRRSYDDGDLFLHGLNITMRLDF